MSFLFEHTFSTHAMALAQADGAPLAPAKPPAPAEDVLTAWTAFWDLGKAFVIDRGPGVLAALALLFLGWLLAGWVRRAVVRGCARTHVDMTLGKFLGNFSRWAILAFVIVTCMGTLGISTTGFATVIGAAGLAIGLALQGNLSNLASGVLLLIFRPFKVGDAVIVAGQTGIVDGIDLFTTNLDTGDNRRIIVPNSAIFGGVIENQTRHPQRQAVVTLPLSGAADLDESRRVLLEAAQRIAASAEGAIKETGPSVALDNINPVTWTVAVWAQTPQHGTVRQALMREIKMAVDGAKIGTPPPVTEVRVTQMVK